MREDRRSFLMGGLSLAGAPALDSQPAPQTLAVVNLRLCFDRDKYARMRDIETEIVALRDESADDIEKLRKRIAVLAEGLNQKTTPSFKADRIRQHSVAEHELKVVQELGRRRLRERADELEGRVYRDIRRAVAKVAAQRKLDLVLRSEEPVAPREEGESGGGVPARAVLYHAPALDITAAVLEALNAEWQKAWTCGPCRRKAAEETCPDCGARKP